MDWKALFFAYVDLVGLAEGVDYLPDSAENLRRFAKEDAGLSDQDAAAFADEVLRQRAGIKPSKAGAV